MLYAKHGVYVGATGESWNDFCDMLLRLSLSVGVSEELLKMIPIVLPFGIAPVSRPNGLACIGAPSGPACCLAEPALIVNHELIPNASPLNVSAAGLVGSPACHSALITGALALSRPQNELTPLKGFLSLSFSAVAVTS